MEAAQSNFQMAHAGRTYYTWVGEYLGRRFDERRYFGWSDDQVLFDRERRGGYFTLEGVLVPAGGSAQIRAWVDGYESEFADVASPFQDCRIVLKKSSRK